jgi:hypothetical protein
MDNGINFKCEDCKFCVQDVTGNEEDMEFRGYRCHRFPPSSHGLFPQVVFEDLAKGTKSDAGGCGEYRQRYT